jgi:hypothetical protein
MLVSVRLLATSISVSEQHPMLGRSLFCKLIAIRYATTHFDPLRTSLGEVELEIASFPLRDHLDAASQKPCGQNRGARYATIKKLLHEDLTSLQWTLAISTL